MSWVSEKMSRIKSLGFYGFFGWVLAKFLFGLGLGLLLASYFQGGYWIPTGWIFIILSVIVSIPALKAVFFK